MLKEDKLTGHTFESITKFIDSDQQEDQTSGNFKIFIKEYDIFQNDYDADLDFKHNEHLVKNVFIPYFTDLYRDLAERAHQTGSSPQTAGSKKRSGSSPSSLSGINRMTFLSFLKGMPVIVAQRLFQLADQDANGMIDLVEFRKILQKIYYSRCSTKLQLCFDIFDFDKDGYIDTDDIRLVLSHIPYKVSCFPHFIFFRPKILISDPELQASTRFSNSLRVLENLWMGSVNIALEILCE